MSLAFRAIPKRKREESHTSFSLLSQNVLISGKQSSSNQMREATEEELTW